MSVGCCIQRWTATPSAARLGPQVRGQCRVRVPHSRPGACTRGLLRTFAQPQGAQEFCTPLGCIQVSPSLEDGPCEGLQGPPATQRVCAWNAPRGARFSSQHRGIPGAKSASHTWVGSGSDRTNGGNGLRGGISLEPRCLQRARELFQILGLEALRSKMSCHIAQGLALTCTVQPWENKQAKTPIFQLRTFEDGGL